MRMMQTKRTYLTDVSSNHHMVLPSNVTTFLRPSTAVRTNKSTGDSKPSLFKTPPLRTTAQVLSPTKAARTQVLPPTKAARVEMLKAKFSDTISKAQQALQSKSKIAPKVAVPKVCSTEQKRAAPSEQKRASPKVCSVREQRRAAPKVCSVREQGRAAPNVCSIREQGRAAPKVCSVREQRRASRKALDAVKPTYDFNANLDAMREFENLLTNGIECNPDCLINNTLG